MTPIAEFSDVVIHVGYHKAGSTLVQQRLFATSRGVYSAWPQAFYHQHVLLDRPDRGWSARVRAAFAPGIAEARAGGLVPVLSCEALSGDMWRVGQANGYGNFHVADVLAEAFPGATVVIVHREQVAMICSLYKHSLRSHWRYDLAHFVDQSPLERGMAPVLNFGYLEYSWLLEHYQGRFGPARVVALPFELVRRPQAWAEQWGGILGVDVAAEWFVERENPGISAYAAGGKRWANHLIPAGAEPNRTRTGHLINALVHKADVRVPEARRRESEHALHMRVTRVVGRRFAEDNRRLAQVSGQSWAPWGYPT